MPHGLKINWKNPETELEHNFRSMLMWRDIWKNRIYFRYNSKYYNLISCAICAYYEVCDEGCPLGDMGCDYFYYWEAATGAHKDQYAYMIYRRIQNNVLKLIKEAKNG